MTEVAKPRYGDPCNGCGQCCRDALCPLARWLFRGQGAPCPALLSEGGRSRCGLIANPARFAPLVTQRHAADNVAAAAGLLCGANMGCDAAAAHDFDPRVSARLRAAALAIPQSRIDRALRVFAAPGGLA